MTAQVLWVCNGYVRAAGQFCSLPLSGHSELEQFEQGRVRIVSGQLGTEVKWSCHSSCVASLVAVSEILPDLTGPFLLRFFYGGWFEQLVVDVASCRSRLNDIVFQLDKPLPDIVLSKHLPVHLKLLPPMLRGVVQTGEARQDLVIDCTFDDHQRTFVVDRVGCDSAIARLFGTSPNSPPCLPFGSYARLINDGYMAVLESGDVRYEQVLASMMFPDRVRRWVPYHRLVVPRSNSNGQRGVSVVTEISDVSLRPI